MTEPVQDLPGKLELSSEIHSIRCLESVIQRIFSEHNIPEDFFGSVLVALTEAANNAILHGNRCDPRKKVAIQYHCDGTMLCFEVTDEGKGFDPDSLPDPTDPENLEKPNGRGVFLMRQLADSMEFRNEGREVCLEFRVCVP